MNKTEAIKRYFASEFKALAKAESYAKRTEKAWAKALASKATVEAVAIAWREAYEAGEKFTALEQDLQAKLTRVSPLFR